VEDASIRRVAEGLQALVRAADASGAPDPAPGAERGARVVQGTFDLARELLEGVARQPSLRPELAAEARRLRGALAAAEEVAVALLEGPRFDQAVLSVVLLVRRTLPEALPGPALQVLTFGTNLASAQDADSVQSVLESTVASAGAWRLKRRPGVHVSVTALPGVAGGFERAILSQGEGAPAVYLFAPVGVELSLLGSEGFGLGLFASVVDVGQLLSLPLDPKTDAERLERAEVRVEQVFSPGLYLKVGLGDTPLVVGGGASLAPGLRDVVAGAPVEGATVVRGVAFVAVDVTLYPF
jgi:hypothetical protein